MRTGPFDAMPGLAKAAALLLAGQFLSYGAMLASAGYLLLFLVVLPMYYALGYAAARYLRVSLAAALALGAAVPFAVQLFSMVVLLGTLLVQVLVGMAAAGALAWGGVAGRPPFCYIRKMALSLLLLAASLAGPSRAAGTSLLEGTTLADVEMELRNRCLPPDAVYPSSPTASPFLEDHCSELAHLLVMWSKRDWIEVPTVEVPTLRGPQELPSAMDELFGWFDELERAGIACSKGSKKACAAHTKLKSDLIPRVDVLSDAMKRAKPAKGPASP